MMRPRGWLKIVRERFSREAEKQLEEHERVRRKAIEKLEKAKQVNAGGTVK